MNKAIYISGPMTGYPNSNKEAFFKASTLLTKAGFVVLNPAINPDGLSYAEYMRIDMAMLDVCKFIYMLTGYEKSKGATAELAYAKSLGYSEIYQDHNIISHKGSSDLCTDLTPEYVDNLCDQVSTA